jgi:hypothetical protein
MLGGVAARPMILSASLEFEKQQPTPPVLLPFFLRLDTLGNAFGSDAPRQGTDSIAILRANAGPAAINTLGFVAATRLKAMQIGPTTMMALAEYTPRDLWGVHMDGTIWIARGQRRELELIAPDGSQTWAPLGMRSFQQSRRIARPSVVSGAGRS